MRWKYVRAILVATLVFTCCYFVLRFWLNLQSHVAAIAATISAIGGFIGAVMGLLKAGLEIEKLRHENRKLKREEAEAERLVKSPTLDEIDKFGLKVRPFITGTREEKL